MQNHTDNGTGITYCTNYGFALSREENFCPCCGTPKNVDLIASKIEAENRDESDHQKTEYDKQRQLDEENEAFESLYRSELRRKSTIINVIGGSLSVIAIIICTKALIESGYSMGEAIFYSYIMVVIIESAIFWLFGLNRSRDKLKKYDKIKKASNHETAVVVAENYEASYRGGCSSILFIVVGIVALVILMSWL